ncbi:hypothetical protein L596_008618 [Steinernema carpocapsae]|uniref:G-protein coupled receptors family 1 profile domain-containing protein n=1 Tax=Steinernema carpocapsae TaxID=34508 RepID=A0A4U5PD52_STECR|nr:hypothetical protein L596_008618 [Steinernema carpocapsae]
MGSSLTLHAYFSAVDACEIAFLLLGTILCFMVVIAMLRICPFHIHLWILLVNLIVCTITFCVFRITSLAILGLQKPNENRATVLKIVELLRFIGLYTGWANLFSLLIERLVATIYAYKYESVKMVVVPIVFIIFTWLLVTWLMVASLFEWISVQIPIIIDLSLNSVSVILFLLMYLLQSKMQKTAKHNLSFQQHHSLSEQYQLNENLQCSRLLIPLIVIMATTSWGSIISYVIKRYFRKMIFEIIFDFILCLRSIMIPICIVRGSRHLFNHVCKTAGVQYRIGSHSENSVDAAPPEEKSAAHFGYLQKTWC